MVETGLFYRATDRQAGTHLALPLLGRLRYIVPVQPAAQKACWQLFQPGRLRLPLEAMTYLPALFAVKGAVESDSFAQIRNLVGAQAGASALRAGTPGPWSKDTILFFDARTSQPLYLVKAGCGTEVDALLRNEALWLQRLNGEKQLFGQVPELIAMQSGKEFSCIVQQPLSGRREMRFHQPQITFLRRFQAAFRRTVLFEESLFYRNLRSRAASLKDLLSNQWAQRLEVGLMRLEAAFAGRSLPMVAAHNDFTPWNIRIEDGQCRVFDWEYAEMEQFPIADPLHFALMPMALSRRSTAAMAQKLNQTVEWSRQALDLDSGWKPHFQALGYLLNLTSLYLWIFRACTEDNPVVAGYACLIDHLCGPV